MNLKEAFRYQNKLQSFMDEAQEILDRDSNVTKVENTYLRHKVMAEAEDETVVVTPDTEYYEQITGIAQFLLYLLGEKEALFAAIHACLLQAQLQIIVCYPESGDERMSCHAANKANGENG